MTSVLKVINPGLYCCVQDLGRFGQNHLGLTTGGCHDPYAFKIANALVGNPINSPALELTLGGFRAEVLVPITIALTGPNVEFTVNNKSQALWQSIQVTRGDLIEIATPHTGLRHTLAISGGIKAQSHFTSVSTVLREGLGCKIEANTPIKQQVPRFTKHKRLPANLLPNYCQNTPLNMVLALQHHEFSTADINRFLNSSYTVTVQSDRMGYRLQGAVLESPTGARFSEGINLGAIQVPADGQPIVLLNDRQTIGGYPKLGSVTALDCANLLQKRAGDEVAFNAISIEKAQTLNHLAQVKLQRALDTLN
ncbi:KipI antagonist [Pseudoalteromonas sp. P1-9]|uniref:5-oxoprolinase subunit C family protein n=1 Tax=Pseudoalteromonas sp. P1-9 TaxID=1710354 RepID=UPI0006D5FAAE|nr:biotin-dependent carboxyltransferase family protein [Pseudoalteromonas sp. P1-9]KPV97278.1 KipI antagonist [Pseudoalteromonas sp. P1-9]